MTAAFSLPVHTSSLARFSGRNCKTSGSKRAPLIGDTSRTVVGGGQGLLDLYFLLSLPAFRLVVCWPAMLKVAGSIDGTEDYTNVAKGGEKRGGLSSTHALSCAWGRYTRWRRGSRLRCALAELSANKINRNATAPCGVSRRLSYLATLITSSLFQHHLAKCASELSPTVPAYHFRQWTVGRLSYKLPPRRCEISF